MVDHCVKLGDLLPPRLDFDPIVPFDTFVSLYRIISVPRQLCLKESLSPHEFNLLPSPEHHTSRLLHGLVTVLFILHFDHHLPRSIRLRDV